MRALFRSGLVAVVAAVAACRAIEPEAERDLADILARDTLVVATRYNSTSYFLYRGQPMGYEYEALRTFAESQGVHLRMMIAATFDDLHGLLHRGEADIIAARVFPDGPLTDRAAFTRPLFETPRVLVQRRAQPAEADATGTMERAMRDPGWGFDVPEQVTVRARLIRDVGDLAGEEVHVGEESAAHRQLVELSDSIDGAIEIIEVEADINTESLIEAVATGRFELTVSRENVAVLKQEQFTNIEVRPVIGSPAQLVWAVRESSPRLLGALNEWIHAEREAALDRLYTKYFVDRPGYAERMVSEYLTDVTGRLSDYDELTMRHAAAIGWDWRLLASQMYQESLFDPRARSWAGAMGLLQLMPATAREVGVTDPYDPEQNVAGGARHLRWLEDQWREEITDPDQRLRFILASYNVGRGHVQDAQRLAEKNGRDPTDWEPVSHWLLQKSKRAVFTDPVVRFGYARGIEPVTYVQKILDRFAHYQQFVPATPDVALN